MYFIQLSVVLNLLGGLAQALTNVYADVIPFKSNETFEFNLGRFGCNVTFVKLRDKCGRHIDGPPYMYPKVDNRLDIYFLSWQKNKYTNRFYYKNYADEWKRNSDGKYPNYTKYEDMAYFRVNELFFEGNLTNEDVYLHIFPKDPKNKSAKSPREFILSISSYCARGKVQYKFIQETAV